MRRLTKGHNGPNPYLSLGDLNKTIDPVHGPIPSDVGTFCTPAKPLPPSIWYQITHNPLVIGVWIGEICALIISLYTYDRLGRPLMPLHIWFPIWMVSGFVLGIVLGWVCHLLME
jgi:hypothetical protein